MDHHALTAKMLVLTAILIGCGNETDPMLAPDAANTEVDAAIEVDATTEADAAIEVDATTRIDAGCSCDVDLRGFDMECGRGRKR